MTLCQEDQKELSNTGGKKTPNLTLKQILMYTTKKVASIPSPTFRASSQDYRYLFVPKDHYNTPVSAKVEDSRAYERKDF